MKHLNQISEKLKEADFFLEQMMVSERKVNELNHYFSAFASAARSVTWVLQFVGSNIEGFDDWYAAIQERQRGDKVAKYLLEARNEAQKKGVQPIAYGQVVKLPEGEERLIHFFSYIGSEPPAELPDMDVISTCRHQMKNLVEIVSEFFELFEQLVWDETKERQEILAQFSQMKPVIHVGKTPDELWQKVIEFLGNEQFKPPKPSDAIRPLVSKYGIPAASCWCSA